MAGAEVYWHRRKRAGVKLNGAYAIVGRSRKRWTVTVHGTKRSYGRTFAEAWARMCAAMAWPWAVLS
jgi:hypothetical protein